MKTGLYILHLCPKRGIFLGPKPFIRTTGSKTERPTRHIIGHFGDGFTGHMTQPTVS